MVVLSISTDLGCGIYGINLMALDDVNSVYYFNFRWSIRFLRLINT